ncbi:MAG: flavin reductase [Clostridiales bacterium]|nr:flavin reductase [Clostridiales bacterium]
MFKEISVKDIKENVVELLSNRWGLVTAGNENSYNMMTVSWGAIGELWGMDMATVYIRPQRYTEKFLNEEGYFTLSFYPDDMKKQIHGICGSKSGRDINKTEACGLTACFDENAPYFKEAQLVLICRKVAKGKFDPNEFIDKNIIDNCYPENDFHYIYYGEIEKVLISE